MSNWGVFMCAVFARQASPGMIRHILAKDWRLLWPMVAFVTLIQICLGWVQYAWGYFGGVAAATHVLHPLTIAWFASITALSVAVVQQDAIPALDQDWLIRPLKRRDLLVAKLLFVALAVSVPMCAVDLGTCASGRLSSARFHGSSDTQRALCLHRPCHARDGTRCDNRTHG